MNSVRSPIAEGVAKAMFGRRIHLDSAGLRRAERDGFALSVLREIGVDFSDDEASTLDQIGLEGFDLIVTLSREAREHVAERIRATSIEHVHWQIDDPTLTQGNREERLAAYRSVRDRIRSLLKAEIAPRMRNMTHIT